MVKIVVHNPSSLFHFDKSTKKIVANAVGVAAKIKNQIAYVGINHCATNRIIIGNMSTLNTDIHKTDLKFDFSVPKNLL